jgi:hypothetical protein
MLLAGRENPRLVSGQILLGKTSNVMVKLLAATRLRNDNARILTSYDFLPRLEPEVAVR